MTVEVNEFNRLQCAIIQFTHGKSRNFTARLRGCQLESCRQVAHVREETLNSYLAEVLDGFSDISAAAEQRVGPEAIDVTVVHSGASDPVPILIEAKIGDSDGKRKQAARQVQRRIGARPEALGFALCYPSDLRQSRPAGATKEAIRGANLAFASVLDSYSKPAWRNGSISDLANSVRNADLPRQRVAGAIEDSVRIAASRFKDEGCGPALARALALPRTDRDLEASVLIGSLMLSNAALLHHRLRKVSTLNGIRPLEDTLADREAAFGAIRDTWRLILAVDYNPVFEPALAALEALEGQGVDEAVLGIADQAIRMADALAGFRFDHAGPLYHRLLASARFDGSFYTNHISAMLLARLALDNRFADWSDVEALANLRIVDPACGTGTLLMGAMHTIRDRFERTGGSVDDSELLHLALVEDVLHGYDINRHGVQLAACNLTLGNPRVDYKRMNLYTMSHGPHNEEAKAGSIEFLATAADQMDLASLAVPLPSAGGLGAERVEPGEAPDESLAGKFNLVIMNPPFTRNDIRNRQYEREDQTAVQERENKIAKYLRNRDPEAGRAIDVTSVQTFFGPIADVLLDSSVGCLSSVVPTTSLTGAAAAGQREFLAKRFQIETIVTSHDPRRVNFSENTAIHESLVIARRPSGERRPTRFISLARMPLDAHEALLLAELISEGGGGGIRRMGYRKHLAVAASPRRRLERGPVLRHTARLGATRSCGTRRNQTGSCPSNLPYRA